MNIDGGGVVVGGASKRDAWREWEKRERGNWLGCIINEKVLNKITKLDVMMMRASKRGTRRIGGERDRIRNEVNLTIIDEIMKNGKINENCDLKIFYPHI